MDKQEKIRELYNKSGLSYTALAELLGINRSTLARWLNGTRTPSNITMEYVIMKVTEYLKEK